MKNWGLALAGGAAVIVAALCIGTLLIVRSIALRQIPPKDAFRLKVETLKDTETSKSFRLTLTVMGTMTDQNTMELNMPIGVEVQGGSWCMTRIGADARTGLCTAVIPITADQIETPQGGRNINLSIDVSGANGRSGGSGTYDIQNKTLTEVFSFTAKSGDYPVSAPLTVGTLPGKGIRILLGERALAQQRLMSNQNILLKDQAVRPGR